MTRPARSEIPTCPSAIADACSHALLSLSLLPILAYLWIRTSWYRLAATTLLWFSFWGTLALASTIGLHHPNPLISVLLTGSIALVTWIVGSFVLWLILMGF